MEEKKPVILHARDAYEDALRILRWHPAQKLGGVIHFFYGSRKIADLKGIFADEVERATAENAIGLFKLPINT